MKSVVQMPEFFDEWVKSTVSTINILMGRGPDDYIDIRNQVLLIKILLNEFDNPSEFKVNAKVDIRMMEYLTSSHKGHTSDLVLLKCINAIANDYEVES